MSTLAHAAPARLSARRARLRSRLAVTFPAALALALCLHELGSRSLWLDEAATASIAASHGAAYGAALARDGGNMLGYYALLHMLVGAFGAGTLVLRLPSAIAAAAAVAITAAIARRLWGAAVALATGLLAAVSLSLVYWGQNARGYAAMIALVAGSFWALAAIFDSERPGRLLWTAYIACTTAAVYATLAAALVVPAQLSALALRRRHRRTLPLGAAAVALLCLPLAVLAARRGSSQLFWVPAPSLRTAKQVAQALASSGLQPGYYTATGDVLLILTGVVALLGIARAARRLRGPRADWRPLLIVAWLVVPLIVELIVSAAGHSIFQARYALVSLPAVALLLAWTLVRTPRLPRAAAALLTGGLIALRALALAPSYGVSTEQWRAAAAFVAAHARHGDCIAFYPLDTRMPFAYYGAHARHLPQPILPTLPWPRVHAYLEQYRTLSPRQLDAFRPACSRAWLVSSHEGRPGAPPTAAANFRQLEALRAALAARYGTPATRIFGHASPITVQLFTAAE